MYGKICKMEYTENYEFGPLSTTSNAQRMKELEKWFEDIKYGEYPNTLHKMLDDPKVKALLDDRYSHLWGDTALDFTVQKVPSCTLASTKLILDLNLSLLPALTDYQKFEQLFIDKKMIDKPIISFRRNYSVDGHHSWIQAIALNPENYVTILDYDSRELSSIEFFRAIHKAEEAEGNNDRKQTSETKEVFNLYNDEFEEKEIKDYIKKNITKDVVDCFVEHIAGCTNRRTTIDWIVKNLLRIKYNNDPEPCD